MPDPSFLDIGSGILGGISDLFNMGSQVVTNAQNVAMQREAWSREDTAVQRRVADLKAAGLSPVLAAGSAAGSQGPIRLSAPQADLGDGLSKYAQMQSMRLAQENATVNIEQTKKQNELLELQKQKAQLEIEFARENNPTKIQAAQVGLQYQSATVMSRIMQQTEKYSQAQLETKLKAQENEIRGLEIRIKDSDAKRQDLVTAKMVADTAYQTAKTGAVAEGVKLIGQKLAQNEFYIRLLKERTRLLLEGNPFGNMLK